MPVFKGHGIKVAIGPFTNRVAIETVDTTDYKGRPGGVIAIHPADNSELDRVLVTVRTDKGGLIEHGAAQWDPDSDCWRFAALKELPAHNGVAVQVLAVASAGHQNTSFGVRQHRRQLSIECQSGSETHKVEMQVLSKKSNSKSAPSASLPSSPSEFAAPPKTPEASS